MSSTNPTIEPDGKCRWCGAYHEQMCPHVKAMEYHPDGSIKRVEFKGASDYFQFQEDRGSGFQWPQYEYVVSQR